MTTLLVAGAPSRVAAPLRPVPGARGGPAHTRPVPVARHSVQGTSSDFAGAVHAAVRATGLSLAVSAAALAIHAQPALASAVAVGIPEDQLAYDLCEDQSSARSAPGTSYYRSVCYAITGVTDNPAKKVVYNADLYGLIIDANDTVALPQRGRLGSLPQVHNLCSVLAFWVSARDA